MTQLVIALDGVSQLEYDRSRELGATQLEALARMDQEMESGITLDGEQVAQPNPLQRAHFTALHLIRAVKDGNESKAVMMTAYLALRIPELRQVRIVSKGDSFDYQFVFDRDFAPESAMAFTPLDQLKGGGGDPGDLH